jgi:hypothetical protein
MRDMPYLEQALRQIQRRRLRVRRNFRSPTYLMMALAMVLEVVAMKLYAFPKVDAYLKRLRECPRYRAISPRTKVGEAPSHA